MPPCRQRLPMRADAGGARDADGFVRVPMATCIWVTLLWQGRPVAFDAGFNEDMAPLELGYDVAFC